MMGNAMLQAECPYRQLLAVQNSASPLLTLTGTGGTAGGALVPPAAGSTAGDA
jgi:hypothetical protein